LLGGLVPLALVSAVGCTGGDDQASQDEELQALLRDKDLTQSMRSALTTAAPNPGSGGASGGSSGAAGAGGAVMVPPGGTAGTVGTAGVPGTAGFAMGGSTGRTDAGAGGFGGSTDVDGGFGGGAGGFGGGFFFGPQGQWGFDFCQPDRTDLNDSGPFGHTAFRGVAVQCTPNGIDGGALAIAQKEDIVLVPDQPTFTFAGGLTTAGWFNPTSTKQSRTLMRKRDQGTSAFALMLNDNKYQLVINLGNGKAASVVAPGKATANKWTHVAGTYDGTWLRLYIDGAEVAKTKAKGTIPPGPGPLLMANDGSERRFDGLMDTAFFDTRALAANEVMALTCIRGTPTVAGSPAMSAPTLPGTPASFDIAITNHSSPSCGPEDFTFFPQFFFPGIQVDPGFSFVPQIAPGATGHVTMNVTATDEPDPGTFTIPFFVQSQVFSPTKSNFAQGSVDFVLAASGCRISSSKELMIKNVAVVDDPVRTTGSGVWTFKHLMEAMAPTAADAPAMVEDMFKTFTVSTSVNGFAADARPGFQRNVLDVWPRTADGKLDLSQPPLVLQAIVNRFDLRDLSKGDAGEGRFVFAFVQDFGFGKFPFQATIILEYKLPASTPAEVKGWADAWHALGALTMGSPEYNAALEAITERFARRGARPGHVNGSAINAVRTNEIDFGINGIWQLREFELGAGGRLEPSTVKLTPDLTFNGTDTLAQYVNANEASIIAETHTVPTQFAGAPFATGTVFNDFFTRWSSPGITNPEARFHFALNTCNGCHSIETNVSFLQIQPRGPGGEAGLSPFLTGTQAFDPFSGTFRAFGDLARRASDLRAVECPGDPGPVFPPPTFDGGMPPSSDGGIVSPPAVDGGVAPPPPKGVAPAGFAPGTSLTKGISRVH
jgi:hypothetical protein